MISLRQPKSKILPERIICTEQAYFKKKGLPLFWQIVASSQTLGEAVHKAANG